MQGTGIKSGHGAGGDSNVNVGGTPDPQLEGGTLHIKSW